MYKAPIADSPTKQTAKTSINSSSYVSDTLAPEATKTRTSSSTYVLIVLLFAALLNGLDSNGFYGAAAVIARELHLGINEIGILSSAFTILLTISIIPIGIWADHIKRHRAIAICLAAWSLATALSGLATNFITLFLSRMFTGIGESGYEPAGKALVGDFFAADQRARALSWLTLSNLIGPILGIVLGGVVAGLFPGAWRLFFLCTGLAGILLAFFAWRLREPIRHQHNHQQSEDSSSILEHESSALYGAANLKTTLTQFLQLFRNKSFVCLTIMITLEIFAATMLQYFPILLQQKDTFGLTSGQAGAFGLVLIPGGIIGVTLGGYLSDRLYRRYRGARMLIASLSLALGAPFILISFLMVQTHNILLFIIFMVPSFTAHIMNLGPLSAAFLDVVPARMRASAIAVSLLCQRLLGAALAPLVLSNLTQSFDPSGQHFLHSVAGHDMTLALILTCPEAFFIAGLVGFVGLRWVLADQERAQHADEQQINK